MLDILRREGIYLWYYFSIQLEQIWGYWVLGMVLGSVISVFAKNHIHGLFRSMHGKRLGVLGSHSIAETTCGPGPEKRR